jgi:hypothetical protein
MSDQTSSAIKSVRELLLPGWYLPKGTRNASEDELEGASSSCEKWGIWCGALVIVSVIAEVIAAIAQPSYDLFLTLTAATDVGVAIGIIGEVALGMFNNRIQTVLRSRSNDKVAAALDRATTAENGLIHLKKPRQKILAPDEIRQLIKDRIRPFSGTEFDVGHPRFARETWDFLWSLEPTILDAGWIQKDWIGGDVFKKRPGDGKGWRDDHVYGLVNVGNVSIEMAPESRARLTPAAEALAAVLNEIGIDAVTYDDNNSSVNPNVIHVLVGPKE